MHHTPIHRKKEDVRTGWWIIRHVVLYRLGSLDTFNEIVVSIDQVHASSEGRAPFVVHLN